MRYFSPPIPGPPPARSAGPFVLAPVAPHPALSPGARRAPRPLQRPPCSESGTAPPGNAASRPRPPRAAPGRPPRGAREPRGRSRRGPPESGPAAAGARPSPAEPRSPPGEAPAVRSRRRPRTAWRPRRAWGVRDPAAGSRRPRGPETGRQRGRRRERRGEGLNRRRSLAASREPSPPRGAAGGRRRGRSHLPELRGFAARMLPPAAARKPPAGSARLRSFNLSRRYRRYHRRRCRAGPRSARAAASSPPPPGPRTAPAPPPRPPRHRRRRAATCRPPLTCAVPDSDRRARPRREAPQRCSRPRSAPLRPPPPPNPPAESARNPRARPTPARCGRGRGAAQRGGAGRGGRGPGLALARRRRKEPGRGPRGSALKVGVCAARAARPGPAESFRGGRWTAGWDLLQFLIVLATFHQALVTGEPSRPARPQPHRFFGCLGAYIPSSPPASFPHGVTEPLCAPSHGGRVKSRCAERFGARWLVAQRSLGAGLHQSGQEDLATLPLRALYLERFAVSHGMLIFSPVVSRIFSHVFLGGCSAPVLPPRLNQGAAPRCPAQGTWSPSCAPGTRRALGPETLPAQCPNVAAEQSFCALHSELTELPVSVAGVGPGSAAKVPVGSALCMKIWMCFRAQGAGRAWLRAGAPRAVWVSHPSVHTSVTVRWVSSAWPLSTSCGSDRFLNFSLINERLGI